MEKSKDQQSTRVGLVTGATSGIGRAIAGRLGNAGSRLILNGRRAQPLEQLANEIRGAGGAVRTVALDNRDPEVTAKLLTASTEEFGEIPDMCFLCAGRGLRGTTLTSDESEWQNLFDINVTATLRQLRGYAAAMVAAMAAPGRSRKLFDVVVIGSTVGRYVSPINPIYGATKFALHSATEALRQELAPKGIRISLIEPGIVRTGFQATAKYDEAWFENYCKEIGPVLDADDIARAALFIVEQPAHVHVNDLMIRPTRQTYP